MLFFRCVLFVAVACFACEICLIWIASSTRLIVRDDSNSLRPVAIILRHNSEKKNIANTTRSTFFEAQRSKAIRNWGCSLKDTPLIFVHIGKTGGGTVRARLAASSVNFSLAIPWNNNHQAYYPIHTNSGTKHAHFCNGEYRNYRPRVLENNFESTFQCYATTPLGMAISCPELFHARFKKYRNNPCPHDPASESADVVYAGHNYFGFEMHWLPEPYLSKWWKSHWATTDDPIKPLLKTLDPNSRTSWCAGRPRQVFASRKTIDFQVDCGKAMQRKVDWSAKNAVAEKLGVPTSEVVSWAPVYATLPVIRIVVMRDPFSWLISKFFWHDAGRIFNLTCDNIEEATFGSGDHNPHIGSSLVAASLINDYGGPGWARRMALGYIHQLCGEDCVARTYSRESTLDELELQAESNLRQGFAVVGLLNETERFYSMLNARIDYLNTSLNRIVRHHKHISRSSGAYEVLCRQRFSDPEFQMKLVAASPEIATLQHLFDVAVDVNRFQLQELRTCSLI